MHECFNHIYAYVPHCVSGAQEGPMMMASDPLKVELEMLAGSQIPVLFESSKSPAVTPPAPSPSLHPKYYCFEVSK